MNFNESDAGVWLTQVINNCLRETGTNQSQIDMNLLVNMCRSEPKSAQVGMQFLAQELRKNLNGRPVSGAAGFGQTWRLMLGCILASYCVSWGHTDRFPPELEQILAFNPEIIGCFNFVMASNQGSFEELRADLDQPRSEPWWKRW